MSNETNHRLKEQGMRINFLNQYRSGIEHLFTRIRYPSRLADIKADGFVSLEVLTRFLR